MSASGGENMSLKIRFLEPTLEKFCHSITSKSKREKILLVGSGIFFQNIVAELKSLKNSIRYAVDIASIEDITAFSTIVFTEEDGEKLGILLMSCVNLKSVEIIAPVTDRHFSRMPLFIVSIPKAGTHLIFQLVSELGYSAGNVMPEIPNAKTWYYVEFSNSHTNARDFFVDTVRRSPFGNRHHPALRSPIIFGYRHPFDILVSEANYYHEAGKTAFQFYFNGLSFNERVAKLINDEWLLGSFRQRVGGFLPWLSMPNVIPTSFEELVGKTGGGSRAMQHRLIWSILLKLQADGCVDNLSRKIVNKNSATFRKGKIGGWKRDLSEEHLKYLKENCADVVTKFGYGVNDSDPSFPQFSSSYAERPLSFSGLDFSEMPLNLDSGYLDCNLVMYKKRFYAIPMSAGELNLTHLSDDLIAGLPNADTLSELKAILLIGKKSFDDCCRYLYNAGTGIRDGHDTYGFWKENDKPYFLMEYKKYNLISWRDVFIGLHQSIGKVDFFADSIKDLIACNKFGDVIVSNTVGSLKLHIDQLSPAFTIASKMVAEISAMKSGADQYQNLIDQVSLLEKQINERVAHLGGRINEMSDRRVNIEGRLASLETETFRHYQDLIDKVYLLRSSLHDFSVLTGSLRAHMIMIEEQISKRIAHLGGRINSISRRK